MILASARGASRSARTPARSPRSAWKRSTRNFWAPRWTSSTAPTVTRSRSSCWFNPSRMHIWTRLKPESQGKTGLGIYPDGMVEHDGQVGQLLKKLDDLGIANNTIVIYTTDNGAETFSWPDGGTTPFRGEKNTNWEGGYRVPAMVRWPGQVPPRTEINDIVLGRGLGDDAGRSRRRARHQRPSSCRDTTPPARPSRFTSTVTISATCSPARVRTSAANSSTGPTTAILPVCATSSGRQFSWSRRRMGSMSGSSRWCNFVCRCCSTFARTRSSGPSTRRETTCAGSSSTPSCSFRHRPSSAQHLVSFQQFPPRQRPGSFSVEQAMEKLRNPPSSN